MVFVAFNLFVLFCTALKYFKILIFMVDLVYFFEILIIPVWCVCVCVVVMCLEFEKLRGSL